MAKEYNRNEQAHRVGGAVYMTGMETGDAKEKASMDEKQEDTDAEATAMKRPEATFAELEKKLACEYASKLHRDVGRKGLATGSLRSNKVTGRGGNGLDEKENEHDLPVMEAGKAVADQERVVEDTNKEMRTIREENIRLIVQARKRPGTYQYVILTGYTEDDLADAVNLFFSMNAPYWKCAGGPSVTPTGLFVQAVGSAGRV